MQGRHATVVAYLALFVALGGSSYAAVKIGSAQIANNSIKSVDVKNRSLLAKDFKAGQLPAPAPGSQGLPGPKGDKGDPGANGTNGAPGTAAGYARITSSLFTASNPDRVVDGADVVIANPPRSKGVLSVRQHVTGSGPTVTRYCFDLTFDPELAVGSAFINNGAFVSTATRRDSGTNATQVSNCPATEPDAAAIVYDAASASHNDVSFAIIFEQVTP
jgi:hypothetical protein